MVTGQGDEAIATEAMRSGASDYIRKTQISVESIARSVEKAVERAALLRKVAQQREEMEVFGSVLVDLKGPIHNLMAFADLIQQSNRVKSDCSIPASVFWRTVPKTCCIKSP